MISVKQAISIGTNVGSLKKANKDSPTTHGRADEKVSRDVLLRCWHLLILLLSARESYFCCYGLL